jgi:hypothetical protein
VEAIVSVSDTVYRLDCIDRGSNIRTAKVKSRIMASRPTSRNEPTRAAYSALPRMLENEGNLEDEGM